VKAILRNESLELTYDGDVLHISLNGHETDVKLNHLQTVVELIPNTTLGKYYDIRVIAIHQHGQPVILFPVSKEESRKVLTGIQQWKLTNMRLNG
jgi:hypothetical protein